MKVSDSSGASTKTTMSVVPATLRDRKHSLYLPAAAYNAYCIAVVMEVVRCLSSQVSTRVCKNFFVGTVATARCRTPLLLIPHACLVDSFLFLLVVEGVRLLRRDV